MALFKRRWKYMVVIILILGVTLPLLLIASYSLPAADDYSLSVRQRTIYENNPSVLNAAVEGFLHAYIDRGVTPLYAVQASISPLLRFGVTGTRVTLFCFNVLFLICSFVFVKWILKGVFKDNKPLHWLIAYLLYVICFIAIQFFNEAFVWISGSIAYLLPISLMYLGLAFFLKGEALRKKRFWALSAVCGSVAAMGPTTIGAMTCGLYAVALLFVILNKKCSRPAVIAVCVVLAMGIVMLLSPGIYNRHDGVSPEYRWASSLETTVNCVWSETQILLRSPVALVFCLFAALSFHWFSFSRKVHWSTVALALAVAVLGPLIVAFPNFFGYGDGYFPIRTKFVVHTILILGFLGVIVSVSAFAKSRIGDASLPKWNTAPLLIVMALFALGVLPAYQAKAFLPLKVTNDFVSGKLEKTNAYWMKTIAEWENAKGQDVAVIWEDQDGYRMPYLIYPIIDGWHDESIAAFYGMNSVKALPWAEYQEQIND